MMLVCCEEILKENEKPLSHHISVLDFFKSPSGACTSKPVLFYVGDDDSDDVPIVQEEELPP
jgi:hypothetical protein